MAQKRMFSMKIIDTDAFLDMPPTTRLLYYDLCMRADDDGFISSPKKITRMVGCGDDDLKILIAKHFIIPFESGVCVIKDWRIHNTIKKDRYQQTIYQEELSQLITASNGTYELCFQDGSKMVPKCFQDGSTLEPQYRLDKVSIDKISKEKHIDIFSQYANENDELLKALKDYDKMRTGMKKKMTDRAKQMLCTKLDELSNQGYDRIQCIEQSILHNWLSVFPLKEKSTMQQANNQTTSNNPFLDLVRSGELEE